MLRTVTLSGAVAAVALATAFASPVQAQTPQGLFGGGSTLASIIYRDLFNCYASDSSGTLDFAFNGSTIRTTGPGCLGANSAVPVNPAAEVLYASVGSGAGTNAYTSNNPASFGTPSSTNPPYTSSDFPSYPYPHVTFAGSDVPMNPTQVSTAATHDFGQPIQVPSLITSVTVPFNPGAGGSVLDIRRPAPTVQGVTGTSGLMLSRENLCGIFNGDINDWSDTRLAVDNNNHQLMTTPTTIKVIFRHDGSGTTGLFVAAILSQCAGTAHPQPAQWAADSPSGAPYTSYFINAKTAGHLPANFHDEQDFDGTGGTAGTETGNAGVIDAIDNVAFTIGYSSPDFTAPFGINPHVKADGKGPIAANIQNQASVTSGAKKFIPPGPATAKLIMNSAPAPTSPDPNVWATAGVNNDPGGANTYPIGGFTWLFFYQCYSSNTVANDLVKGSIPGLLSWLYGASPDIPAILGNQGFSPLPTAWKTAIKGFYTQGTLDGGAAKIRKGPSGSVCSAGAA